MVVGLDAVNVSAEARSRVGERVLVSDHPRIDRRRGTGPPDKDDALAAGLEEVCRDDVSGASVVDTHQIVVAALRVGNEVAIEEHDRNSRLIEHLGKAQAHLVRQSIEHVGAIEGDDRDGPVDR